MEQIITVENVNEAVQAIRAKVGEFAPRIAIILGSGLNGMAEHIENATCIPYEEVPHMVASTASLHVGRLVCGELAGVPVVCMQGRNHAYEGYSAQQIAFPVHVMHALGAQMLIITNAAGGIDTTFNVGDLMLIEDHINFQMMNPCIGMPEGGAIPRFFDMTHAYSPDLRALACKCADKLGISLQSGVYIADLGPSFETPAEIRAFRALGADAVGMSTVQEVIAANQLGMQVLGISLISNPAAGINDEPLDMDDVVNAAHLAAERMGALVMEFITQLSK